MPQTLDELRAALDDVDGELARLIERRFELTDKIGAYKRAHGLAVRDEKREAAVAARLTALLRDGGKAEELAALYELLFSLSRARQERGERSNENMTGGTP